MGLRGGRGRTTALVAAAVLTLLVGAVWTGAQATWTTTSPPPRPSPTEGGGDNLPPPPSLPSTGLSSTGLSGTGLQPGWQGDWPSGMDYVSAALKFGLVLLLLYGALWALRRYARTGFVRGATDSRRLALLETMPLAPRQALHLVRADDRTLLLGASERGIVFLADLTAPMDDRPQTMDDRQPIAAPSPRVGEGWGGGDNFTPTLSLPHQRGGDVSLLQGEGIARLASAFAQHLRQAIQWREHHAA